MTPSTQDIKVSHRIKWQNAQSKNSFQTFDVRPDVNWKKSHMLLYEVDIGLYYNNRTLVAH